MVALTYLFFGCATVCIAQNSSDHGCDDDMALLSNRHRVLTQNGLDACVAAAELMTFGEFMAKYHREYMHGSEEYNMRKAFFEARHRDALLHNCKPERSWSAGVNHLSDRTDAERTRLLGWRHRSHPTSAGVALQQTQSEVQPSTETFLRRVDWNLKATKARDQGQCGSCWAITAIELLEAGYEIRNPEKSLHLALQDFVDCVDNPQHCGGTGGCEGATVELAVDYFLKNPMNTEPQNGYLAGPGNKKACAPQKGVTAASIGLSGYRTLPSNKIEQVMSAMQSGPVAVSIQAPLMWFLYFGGIMDGCDQHDTTINHAVLMTGYGQNKKNKMKFWKIMNSWGPSWGEKGYIRMARQDTFESEERHCGTDNKPEDGVACDGGPPKVTVCGTCGVLYDVVALNWK